MGSASTGFAPRTTPPLAERGSKEKNKTNKDGGRPPLVNIYAVTSILWFFFAVALFGWFLYLGITDKWRRYFVSSVTPGWFWFSVFWQALWAIVRLMIANIVGKFAQLLQTIGRQRMSEVEQQGRRAVLVYY